MSMNAMRPRAAAKRQRAEELLPERERLVDVADLERDVVDPDEPRHGPSLPLSNIKPVEGTDAPDAV